ncbi:hypothetical protein LARV_03859 [Longilinea arvoryzae]|uniref:Uncharacterized protein n=1 Tax=Longilinea arvoryzae TaxID=360412 RepID=A0A0K8MXT1_9CHLR|nr:hypothetical protein [Longilinea arvoryzae]GAP16063.1 hypothetical protein LARV_03859 [Longilinea arvoryzae]
MEIIGARIVLTIDEPWDSYRVINGKVTQLFTGEDDSPYLLIVGPQSAEVFVVSPRYENFGVDDIVHGKKLIVDIAVPIDNKRPFDKDKYFTNLKYIGIGAIELAPLDG